jgi:hypothetical protein
MFSRLLLILVFSLAGRTLFAQSASSSPAEEPSTAALLDQIQQLQKRLSEMEERQRKSSRKQKSTLPRKHCGTEPVGVQSIPQLQQIASSPPMEPDERTPVAAVPVPATTSSYSASLHAVRSLAVDS